MTTLCAAVPGTTLMPGLALVLGALTMTALWRLRRLTSGTTLTAAWLWAAGAVAATSAVAFVASGENSDSRSPIYRYLAGILLLAPPLALLGAKRPQNIAWQWVVVAFLALLALPAARQCLYRPGGALELETAWQWLLLTVAVIGVVNYLPTARSTASMLYAAAQVCWLVDQFPHWLRFEFAEREVIGSLFLCAATWVAARTPRRTARAPLDRLWLDFRDAFGLAWTLRVAEQFNSTAARSGWPIALGWNGARRASSEPNDAPLPPAALQCLENLLRRFVSRDWIEVRLGDKSSSTNADGHS